MPEEILHHRGPIAVIPIQSQLAAQVHQLKLKLGRTKKKEARDLVETQLKQAESQLEKVLKDLGRA